MSDPLLHRVLSAYHELLERVCTEEDITPLQVEWTEVDRELQARQKNGNLDKSLALSITSVAANVAALLSGVNGLYLEAQIAVTGLKSEIELGLFNGRSGRRDSHDPWSCGKGGARRHDAPHSTESLLSAPAVHQKGHVRDWFLSHLPYPYPTYSEKRNLAMQAGIPLSKIDSDLTNWRRRSGWGEICETYARKSKDRMRMLMLRVQSGEETRPDLLEKVEGIRRYMDKECDKVGDWVHELASFARPEKRPKLDHASPTNTTPHHGGHRSFSFLSSSSSLSDISAFATMNSDPSETHTRDSPPTRSVSGSSTLSDASIIVPSQGPKRSMSFTDDVEQVTNKAKTSHTPLGAEPTWVDSPTEYASSDTSGFSGTYVSLDAASNSLSSFTASSESSLPSSGSDDSQHTGDSEMVVESATAVSNVLTVVDSIMDSECSSIWSTELELPSLPHMHNGSESGWRIPTLSEFRPEIGRWVERG